MNKTTKKLLILLVFSCVMTLNLHAEKQSSAAEEEASEKNYTGWIDTTQKDISVRMGDIRLNSRTKLGTFNISVFDDGGKRIPVLYSGNEYTTSVFYLKVNKKIYKLIAGSNIKTTAQKTKSGMQLKYSIKNVADVLVDFKCLKSTTEAGYDMVKISASVVNKSGKKADFALKLVLDTVLGETGNAHFYTNADVPVKAEVLYRTMQNEKWFVSKNSSAEMQILLDGGDITPPDVVALANYSTLEQNTWEPEMLSYRTFDTVLSYNNSAIGIIWPVNKTGSEGSFTDCFYLGFATDGNKAQGQVYLSGLNDSAKDVLDAVENLANKPVEDKSDVQVIEVELPDVKGPETEKKEEPVVIQQEPPVSVIEAPKVEESVPEEKITPVPEPQKPKNKANNLSNEQLTQEYIQNLIDRISAMEQDPELASEEEIKLLNAELDAILQALM